MRLEVHNAAAIVQAGSDDIQLLILKKFAEFAQSAAFYQSFPDK